MANLILPSRRIAQPKPMAAIDWDLIGAGAFVYHPGDPFSLRFANGKLTGTEGSNNGSAVFDAVGVGRRWSGTGVNAGLEFGNVQPFSNNTAYTVLVVGAPVAESSSRAVVGQRYGAEPFYIHAAFGFNRMDGSNSESGSVNLLSINTTLPGQSVTAQNQIDGATHVWVASNSTTTGYIYRDGVKQTLSVNQRLNTTYVNSLAKFEIGSVPDSTAAAACQYPIYLIVGWPTQLSESLAQSLSANPWQIFAPQRRVIHFDMGGGGSSIALAGDAQAAATLTGAITSVLALSGAGVSLSTATGAIVQSLNLSGSAASVSIANGVATITTTLSGDAFNAAFASGLINQAMMLDGASASAATTTGAIAQTTSMAGDASAAAAATGSIGLTVTLSGDAVAQAMAAAYFDGSASPLAGSAQVSATASGALLMDVGLLGAAQAIVTGAGGITQTQTLTGGGAVVASGSGNLSLNSVGLSGAAVAEVLAGGSIQFVTQISAAALSRATAQMINATVLASDRQIEKWTMRPSRNYTMIAPTRNYTLAARA